MIEASSGAALPGRPSASHACIPTDFGQELQFVEPDGVGMPGGGRNAPRYWQGRGQLQRRRHLAPVGREHLKRLAAQVLYVPGFGEQRRIETAYLESIGTQAVFDATIALDHAGFVATAPVHRIGTRLANEFAQCCQ